MPLVNELGTALAVEVEDDTVYRGTLGGVRGGSVAQIDLARVGDGQCELAAVVEFHRASWLWWSPVMVAKA